MTLAPDDAGIVRIPLPTPFMVGPVNVFLVKDGPLTLVDTGPNSEEAYEQLTQALRENGVALADLEVILVTHGHLDHIGLLGRLREETKAAVYAHPHAAARLATYGDEAAEEHRFVHAIMHEFGVPDFHREEASAEQSNYKPFGGKVHIQQTLADGARVGRFTAYYVPGHSSSDTLLVDLERKFAFVGDHLLRIMNPNPLIRRPLDGQPRARSLVEFVQSLERTRSLGIERCYPGHGEAFDHPEEVIDRLLNRIQERSKKVLGCLQQGSTTPYEISVCLYPRLETKNLYLGLSVAIGHLELLEAEGQVTVQSKAGTLHYSAAQAV